MSLRKVIITHRKIMDKDLQEQIGKQLKKAIAKERLSIVQAARQLGISRQSLHSYLGGAACPRLDILYRACLLWDVVISYNGYRFGIRSKSRKKQGAHILNSRQLPLAFTFEDVKSRDVDITLGKKTSRSVELRLSINIGA